MSPMKNIIPSGNSSVCAKTCTPCLKCNLTREEKEGKGYARVRKRRATIIIPFGHPSTVQDFSSTLGKNRSKSFSNRYVFSHPLGRYYEVSKEYKSYRNLSPNLALFIYVYVLKIGDKKDCTINCSFFRRFLMNVKYRQIFFNIVMRRS